MKVEELKKRIDYENCRESYDIEFKNNIKKIGKETLTKIIEKTNEAFEKHEGDLNGLKPSEVFEVSLPLYLKVSMKDVAERFCNCSLEKAVRGEDPKSEKLLFADYRDLYFSYKASMTLNDLSNFIEDEEKCLVIPEGTKLYFNEGPDGGLFSKIELEEPLAISSQDIEINNLQDWQEVFIAGTISNYNEENNEYQKVTIDSIENIPSDMFAEEPITKGSILFDGKRIPRVESLKELLKETSEALQQEGECR